MITKIIEFSVQRRWLVIGLIVIISIWGWFSFERLPIDAVPDITNVQVQINTSVEGFVPQEIERLITFPIESAMGGIKDVDQIRSISRFGLSQVTIVFADSMDIYLARQLISERLQTVITELPNGAQPKLGPISAGLGEIYHYTIQMDSAAAEKVNGALDPQARIRKLMEFRALQEWYIKPRLMTVGGVAEINTIGGYEKQFHIQPEPQRMAQYGLHFDDLITALKKTNRNVGGGYVEQSAEQFLVQANGLFKSPDQLTRVPIKSLETYRTVTMGDVAQVAIATELRMGAALVNGEEAVLGTVFMRLGENSREVSLRVGERIEEIRKGLPPGVVIKTLYDRSELVNATLGTVKHNLLTGAALVVLVLLLLLGNIRAALITAVTIPISLLMTFILMKHLGISGNLMSLGALDFGIIVDGVVIVMDHCVRVIHEKIHDRRQDLTRREIQESVVQAATEIRKAAGFGQIIVVMIFVPIFALVGIEGKMFKPMAATFVIAILSAFILSFTLAPALASLILKGNTKDREPWLMRKLNQLYAPFLDWSLTHRTPILVTGAAAVVLGLFLFSFLGGEFLPQLDERSLAVQFVRPTNISLTQSVEFQKRSEKLIQKFPEVAEVFSRIGTAEVATDPMGVNLADTYVILKQGMENKFARSKEEFSEAIRNELNASIGGQRVLLTQPIQMRFNELLEGTRADVAVKLFGDNLDQLAHLSQEVAAIIRSVEGAGDVELESNGKSPLLRIDPKIEVLNRLGLSQSEVLDTVGIAIGGEVVSYFYEGTNRFSIVLRLSEEKRSNLDSIRNLPVGINGNATIPLAQVANVYFEDTYGLISREQRKRRAAILVNPRGRDTQSFVEEAKAAVEKKVSLPAGYFIEWSGNFKNLQEAASRLAVLTPVALVLILSLVYMAFNSFSQTFLIFSCVPLALVGGVLGLIAGKLPFSISAGVGFIAVSGIAVLNGVVLINYFNELKSSGMRGFQLIKQGALMRLRPVLMTALVDIFGFLPMMFSHGVGAEVQRPLALVIVGGIFSSTLLTLIVLPTLYTFLEKNR